MPAHGNLPLEDNSEVGEALPGRCRFPASAPVLSSSQPKKQNHSLPRGPPGRGFCGFPYLWSGRHRFDSWMDQVRKGLVIPIHVFSHQPQCPRANLVAWKSMVCREPSLLVQPGLKGHILGTSSLGPEHTVPFHGHWGATAKHTYIHSCMHPQKLYKNPTYF